MNPALWVGLGFVASSWNASVDEIKSWGPISSVAPQICWGTDSPHRQDDENLINGCRRVGLVPYGWCWCNGGDVETEARYHAQRTLELALGGCIANMEEPYDAHGDSSNPRYQMANRYATAFRAVAPGVELGVTTTPLWASDGTGLRAAGATVMPQCFTGEVTSGDATIPRAVEHAKAWGWTVDRIRPLVQTYATGGVVPDPNIYNADSFTYSVGVVPYTLEQASADVIRTLSPSISRLPAQGPTPIPPPEIEEKPGPPEGGGPPPLDLPFARALYPPDAKAKGKTPSKDGPDVIAVKRAISRAGFWRWQKFDDTYSNAFSHGSSSNGPGVQGFQTDHVAAQPTGWYGKTTHETLVKFLIPANLPNGGEWAFDKQACDLYRQASG